MLRLAFVTGTEPGKWFARYRDTTDHGLSELPSDDPLAAVISGDADLALMRLPDARVGAPGETFHQVRLYAEQAGVAVPKDSVYAEVGEPVRLEDLQGEHVNAVFGQDLLIDDLRVALHVVAANVGAAYAPVPLLKVLSKKQVVVLPIADRDGPRTEIALVWKVRDDGDAIQDFVGVAKGRTRNSSRGARGPLKNSASSSNGRKSGDVGARAGRSGNLSGAKKNKRLKNKSGGQRNTKRGNHPRKGVGWKRT